MIDQSWTVVAWFSSLISFSLDFFLEGNGFGSFILLVRFFKV